MAGAAFWGNTGPNGPVGPPFSDRPWDIAFVDGTGLPGICDIRGKTVTGVEIDTAKAKGRNGARITITGYKPGQFEIICEVWTNDQWEWLQAITDPLLDKIKAVERKTKIPQVAVAVGHPALQFVKIFEAALTGITPPENGTFVGGKIVRFQMFESVPPGKKDVTRTVKGASYGRVQEYRSGEEPKHTTPPKPSADPKKFTPTGQKPVPDAGPT